jgi:hypothetical protein
MYQQLNIEQSIDELYEFAATEGVPLPYAADFIAWVEQNGGMVDLITGDIIRDGASWCVEATIVGEALHVVLTAEEEAQR